MATAKLFKNGGSQSVRLPKEFRFPGQEVRIYSEGRRVVLEPLDQRLDTVIDALAMFTADFMPEGRQQPPMQKRR
jgi:antitoxin VapB